MAPNEPDDMEELEREEPPRYTRYECGNEAHDCRCGCDDYRSGLLRFIDNHGNETY
jgi:hypothetical protein